MSVQSTYINHLKNTDPFLFAVAKKVYEIKHGKSNALNGLSGFDFMGFLQSVSEAAPKIANSIATVKISQANVARAKAGQEPLDVESYVQTNSNYNPNDKNSKKAVNIAAQRVADSSDSTEKKRVADSSDSTEKNSLLIPAVIIGGAIIAFAFLHKAK